MNSSVGWFAGPKGENGEWFASVLARIVQDYYSWRRNYFPEDGMIIDSQERRTSEPFRDEFEDRLFELLARLKADFPFQSPRYAAHMIAEQTMPSIAGYFAAMLYNPNNVSRESAPVTVRLELEASRMICKMLGYGDQSWGHLTGGGTIANIEALWVARTVAYLPQVVSEMRQKLGLDPVETSSSTVNALREFSRVFSDGAEAGIPFLDVLATYLSAEFCVVERGLYSVVSKDGKRPVVLVPETHHYCFDKALDALGIGRDALVRVSVDTNFRMDVADLAAKLNDCEQSGCRTLAVVAVVGTTEEGAIDPVHEILDLRESRSANGKDSFWLHIDGAYGGYLRTMTTPSRIGLGEPWSNVIVNGTEVRLPLDLPVGAACDALEKLGEADSITVDPHKLGYIPYPAGAVCFRSDFVKPLVRQEAPYIGDGAGNPETERNTESIGLYILEGSKPGAAAAAVWLSHSLISLDTDGHGRLIQETVRNACELHALLEKWPEWRPDSKVEAVPLTHPASNIVCYAFRPRNRSATLSEINELNGKLYAQFSVDEASGRRMYDQQFFVSRTTLRYSQYRLETVAPFLERLDVTAEDYQREGIFLLRSVLMNPWFSQAKSKGRYFLAEMVESLFAAGDSLA